VQPSEQPCHISWRQEPPTPAQLAAWRQLWTRLLGHPGPETPQPQEDTPGAIDGATVSGGCNLNEDTANDTRIALHRK
jgi:hypothetical protein